MAKSKRVSPLTDDHRKILDRLLAACAETDSYCQMCEECDLDVSPEREKNRDQMRVAQKIRDKFFPPDK